MSEGEMLRVLLVVGTPDQAQEIARALVTALAGPEPASPEPERVVVHRVTDALAFAEALAGGALDVVVTESILPWASGFTILGQVKERFPGRPVLLLTEHDRGGQAASARRAGFAGAVPKGPGAGDRLAVAIRSAVDVAARLEAGATEDARLELLERERAALAGWRHEAAEKALILELIEDAVVLTDGEGRPTAISDEAARLLGVDRGQAIGLALHEQPWQAFDEGGEPLRDERRPLRRALRGERVRLVGRLRTADGREAIVRAASAPVVGEDGDVVGTVSVARDLTEEYARARQVAEGAKLRALGELAGGVAHDLNQYLGLVAGYGELALEALGRRSPDITSARDSIATMIRGALDGAETVRRLLLFARPTPEGPPRHVDLADVLRDVAKLTAPRWRDESQQQGRPISVDLEVEGAVGVLGWPGDLREAFANLMLNAVDALPNGGTIRLAARAQGDRIVAEVGDNGIGIAPHIFDRLFEPFFSTKGERGSGLGLAIVYGIVERHGGTVGVESALGRGTTFRLSFPLAAPAGASDRGGAVLQSERRFRILAVDDEPALVTMLARLLSVDGHDVTTALSGEEALEILAQHPVDVVITDLGLGAGMNGWDLIAAIRERRLQPVIFLATGWGADIEERQAAERGVRAVIPKPFRLGDLRQLLAQV